MTPQPLTSRAANTAGHTKKATLSGLFFVGNSVSNIVAPQLYIATEGGRSYSAWPLRMLPLAGSKVDTPLLIHSLSREPHS